MDAVDRGIAAAELSPNGGAASGAPLEAGVSILRALVGMRGLSRMGHDAAHGCRVAEAGSPWVSIGRLVEGVAWRLRGDLWRARTSLEACERLATTTSAPVRSARRLTAMAIAGCGRVGCESRLKRWRRGMK